MRTTFAAIMIAALMGIVGAAAASAAPQVKAPSAGNWLGKTTQDISLTDKPWSVLISVTALHGRLVTVATTIRTECPGPTIHDIRILKSFGLKGPRLSASGSFAVKVSGVSISGGLGRSGASGHFSAFGGGCEGSGSWSARRQS